MRAVRASDGQVAVVDVAAPSGDGVRVRVRAAGICGSDLHMLAGGFPIGHTLGHEIAGVLDDGTPVAVEPLLPCGGCEPCTSGDYHLCRRGPGIVIGIGHDGGMAEELRVPERCLVPLPKGVAVGDASLVEPLAVAVHGLRLVGAARPRRVAVIGGGSIGLCATAALRAQGAEVTLFARHPHQQESGRRMGATIGEGEGEFALVVDAAGSASALEQAARRCAPGGTLLLLATYWSGRLELPSFDVTLKELRVVPSSLYARAGDGRDIDAAAAVLAGEPELPGAMITHRFPLEAAPEAFHVAGDRAAGAIKVVLEP